MDDNGPGAPRSAAKSDHQIAASAALLDEIDRLRNELIRAEWRIAELEARADIDASFDVFNRRGFERELARSIAYVRRYGTAAALLYIDLDGFKAVNDRHGHAAGDAVLQAVVARLKARVRASDVIARLGGDEFAVLMWNVGEEHALAKARELEQVIGDDPVTYGDSRISVGASAGIVPLSPDADAAALIGSADAAMYARKKQRKE